MNLVTVKCHWCETEFQITEFKQRIMQANAEEEYGGLDLAHYCDDCADEAREQVEKELAEMVQKRGNRRSKAKN